MTIPTTQPSDIARDFNLYEGDPNNLPMDIYSWSPTPEEDVRAGKPQAPSTQVHLLLRLPTIGKAVYRFKGIGSLDRLIAALIKHRVDVWGVPPDQTVWSKSD